MELRFYMNRMAFDSFQPARTLEALLEAGYRGVQFVEFAGRKELNRCRVQQLGVSLAGRINLPCEASPFAARAAGDGYECATVHLGWGLEDEAEAHALIEALLDAEGRHGIPLYPETHRATLFQDMWRTTRFVKRFPELRFNGDFSHWYAGQEMVYGGFEKKLRFIEPVLARVRFLHGRIASPGCIQVAIDGGTNGLPPYVGHFRQMWTAAFRGALASGAEAICFTPELLGPDIFYARVFAGIEESDRWEQSLLLNRIARECFDSASSL